MHELAPFDVNVPTKLLPMSSNLQCHLNHLFNEYFYCKQPQHLDNYVAICKMDEQFTLLPDGVRQWWSLTQWCL